MTNLKSISDKGNKTFIVEFDAHDAHGLPVRLQAAVIRRDRAATIALFRREDEGQGESLALVMVEDLRIDEHGTFFFTADCPLRGWRQGGLDEWDRIALEALAYLLVGEGDDHEVRGFIGIDRDRRGNLIGGRVDPDEDHPLTTAAAFLS